MVLPTSFAELFTAGARAGPAGDFLSFSSRRAGTPKLSEGLFRKTGAAYYEQRRGL